MTILSFSQFTSQANFRIILVERPYDFMSSLEGQKHFKEILSLKIEGQTIDEKKTIPFTTYDFLGTHILVYDKSKLIATQLCLSPSQCTLFKQEFPPISFAQEKGDEVGLKRLKKTIQKYERDGKEFIHFDQCFFAKTLNRQEMNQVNTLVLELNRLYENYSSNTMNNYATRLWQERLHLSQETIEHTKKIA